MSYHGEVLDGGKEFLTIETEGPWVILKVTVADGINVCGIDAVLSPGQAREFARHLSAAVETVGTFTSAQRVE